MGVLYITYEKGYLLRCQLMWRWETIHIQICYHTKLNWNLLSNTAAWIFKCINNWWMFSPYTSHQASPLMYNDCSKLQDHQVSSCIGGMCKEAHWIELHRNGHICNSYDRIVVGISGRVSNNNEMPRMMMSERVHRDHHHPKWVIWNKRFLPKKGRSNPSTHSW